METLIIHTEGRKLKLIKQLLKELGIDFETTKETTSPYNPDFVAKIMQRKADADEGEYVELTGDYKKELFGE